MAFIASQCALRLLIARERFSEVAAMPIANDTVEFELDGTLLRFVERIIVTGVHGDNCRV